MGTDGAGLEARAGGPVSAPHHLLKHKTAEEGWRDQGLGLVTALLTPGS